MRAEQPALEQLVQFAHAAAAAPAQAAQLGPGEHGAGRRRRGHGRYCRQLRIPAFCRRPLHATSGATGGRATWSFPMQSSATPATATDLRPAIQSARNDTTAGAGMRNMQQLIQLRWIAIVGQLATIVFVHSVLGIGLPLAMMLSVAGCLALFNLGSQLFWRARTDAGDLALLLALLVDVAALTAQLHLSGGITNPFVFLYL